MTRLTRIAALLAAAVSALALAAAPAALARGGADDPPGDDRPGTTTGSNPGPGGGGTTTDDDDDDPEVPPGRAPRRGETRAVGACGAGARSELRLSWEDGGLEAEFAIEQSRRGQGWRVVMVLERRVAWSGRRVTGGRSASITVRRVLSGYDGPNAVSVRAWGPRGLTCRASATLTG
ncbi:MAG: hypothetical protein MUE51_11475 [Thermoleophilia bacterium]|nr:hypothetical protein [Thermoleophilia bacterium]